MKKVKLMLVAMLIGVAAMSQTGYIDYNKVAFYDAFTQEWEESFYDVNTTLRVERIGNIYNLRIKLGSEYFDVNVSYDGVDVASDHKTFIYLYSDILQQEFVVTEVKLSKMANGSYGSFKWVGEDDTGKILGIWLYDDFAPY